MAFLILLFLVQFVSQQLQVAPPPAAQSPAVAPADKPAVPPGLLKGHVYAADTGAPIKRAQVTLHAQRRQSEPFTTTTDNQGTFEFRNVEPGSYSLTCYKTGFVQAALASALPKGKLF